MFKKWLIRTIFIISLISGLAGLTIIYILANGLASPEPEKDEIQYAFDSYTDSVIEDNSQLKIELKAKKTALNNQLTSLEIQRSLLEEKKKEIEEKIDAELLKIRDKYQARINEKGKLLSDEFKIYREKKEQEYKERILAKKEFLKKELENEINLLQKVYADRLSEYEARITNNYYPDILNIQLKLRILDLTSEERERYREKLTNIEQERNRVIQTKKENLESEMQSRIKELDNEYNKEFINFQKKLEKELTEDLEKKRAENDKLIKEYIAGQQVKLNEELKQKRQELRQRIKDDLIIHQRVISEIEKEYYSLQSELFILEKEVIE